MKQSRIPGALIAARFSTDNQDADSIDIQVERCTAYCNQRGIPVLDIYADYGVSGMKEHRPELDRLMADLRAGKGDTVVILDQSRMVRDMPHWFRLRQEIAALGVQVVSVTQPFVGGDTRDPNTFMMETSSAMINHMWVLQTRQKVLAKMRYMAKNGQHTGGKPALGYRVEDGQLVIDEEEAKIVRRIFREYDSGKSYKAIIDSLNADGIRTKRGNAFGSNSLHDMLHNEKYIGILTYGAHAYRVDGTRNTHKAEGTDVVRIEDALPAIIDKDVFARVQQRMAENKHSQGGRPAEKREYPLRGKVFCGECGAAMHVRTSKGGYFYYNCNSKKNKHEDCGNKPIRVEALEDLVLQYVRAIVGNPTLMQATIDRMKGATSEIRKSGAARMQALINEQFNVDAQIKNAMDVITSGFFTPSLGERLKALEAQKAQLAARIAETKKAADLAALPEERLQALFNWITTSAMADPAAIFGIVTRVEVFRDSVKIFTSFDPDDPTKRSTDRPEVIETVGTPSGVPIVFITLAGIGLTVRR